MSFLAPLIFCHTTHVEAIISLSAAITWNRRPWARLIKIADFLFFMCPPGIYSFALLRTQHWSHRPSTITCIPHLKRYSRRLCSRTLKETCVMLRWFSVFGCKDWMIISSWSKYLTVTVARVHSISCKGSWLSVCAELFQKIRCIKFWQTYSGLK